MAATAKKKGNKGLMIGLVLLFIFGGAGAVAGLALSRKVNIPGLTPKQKTIPTPIAKPKAKTTAITKKESDPVAEAAKAPAAVNDKQGATKLAEIWNEMTTDKLAKVVEKWKPTDLAVILNEMDPAKVADILAAMKPERASTVSQEMRKLAAQLPAE
jgi:hypothetical protein